MPERSFDPELTQRLLGPGDRVFGRYTLESIAGRGGMGVVWRAHDDELDRTVALKFLSDAVAADPEAVRDLKRETKRCLELTHANIVRVYDFVSDAHVAAIAMEFVDGQSLARLKAEAPNACLPIGKLAPLVAQLCAALDYAHRHARVVHRDLKPANLLVTRDERLKVTDFGIASSLIETRTRLTGMAGKTVGTLPYMSPQQLAGDRPNASDDIYSLGATLYELLASKPPFFRGDWTSLVKQIAERAPAPLAERRCELEITGEPIPPAWEQTILACLAKDQAQRPVSAKAVAQRLGLETLAVEESSAPQEATTPAPPVIASPAPQSALAGVPGRPTPPRKRRPLAVAGIAALLVATGLGIFVGVYAPQQRQRSEQAPPPEVQRPAPDVPSAAQVAPEAARPPATPEQTAATRTQAEPEPPAQARGGISVRTTPEGAEVWVDSLAVGKSPLTLSDQKLGPHAVRIRLDGHEEWSSEVDVPENAVAPLTVTLVRSTGSLRVTSRPPDSTVALAGEVFRGGKTPATFDQLPTGRYLVTISREGWTPHEQTIEISAGQQAEVDAEFPPAKLAVTSEPAGAAVFQQGVEVGRTPWETEATPGEVSFELKKDGFWPASVQGTLEAGRTLRLTASLERHGPRSGHDWAVPDLGLALAWIKPGTFTLGATNGITPAGAPLGTMAGLTPPPANATDAEKLAYAAGAFLGGLIQRAKLKKAGEISDGKDEAPPTIVAMTQGYWLGRREVSQQEWWALMATSPAQFKGADLPVESVSWQQATEFCRRLSERERAAGRLPANLAYTLPTEAQWEYACQAGQMALDVQSLDARAWWSRGRATSTSPCGGRAPNAWGLYDMNGNVWEWCLDWYGRYPGGRVDDYAGPKMGAVRVLRGGSWANTLLRCRSAARHFDTPDSRSEFAGFRVALSPVR